MSAAAVGPCKSSTRRARSSTRFPSRSWTASRTWLTFDCVILGRADGKGSRYLRSFASLRMTNAASLLFGLVDRRRLRNLGHRLERNAFRSRRRAGAEVLAIFFEALEEMMQVVGQPHDRAAQFVFHPPECIEVL